MTRFVAQIIGYRWKTKFAKMILLVFIACTYILSIGSADAKPECPTISSGFYPFCFCTHGPAYDMEKNICPNPECPANDSVGIYPNCTCQHKNFDYSSTFNECFQVCPENSSGYWPKCNCDSDGYVFKKEYFSCVTCPADSTGQYPNCNCGDDSFIYEIYSNVCEESTESTQCPYSSNGKYPNCICKDDRIYNASTNDCDKCPYDSTGIYPDCICEDGFIFDGKYCESCPFVLSVGVYPNCICLENNSTYVRDSNRCYTCPTNSTGQYPNCDCDQPSHQYIQETNICVGCPENSEGVYPHCKCLNGYFSQTHIACIECPKEATGIYPACQCNDQNLVFSAYLNQCYLACPENSSGIQPQCTCDDLENYYDSSDDVCKSNIGRICPFDSIGIGPDCLCIRQVERFDSDLWNCINKNAQFLPTSGTYCPDNGKWPQCESSININVLRTAVG